MFPVSRLPWFLLSLNARLHRLLLSLNVCEICPKYSQICRKMRENVVQNPIYYIQLNKIQKNIDEIICIVPSDIFTRFKKSDSLQVTNIKLFS